MRVLRPWSTGEVRLLKLLCVSNTPAEMKKAGYFCGVVMPFGEMKISQRIRTQCAIGRKMQTEGLQAPKRTLPRKIRGKNWKELKLILQETRNEPTEVILDEIEIELGIKISRSTLAKYQKKLNMPRSWKEAAALPDSWFKSRNTAEARSRRIKKANRTRKRRLRKILNALAEERYYRKFPPATCKGCGINYPLHRKFFRVNTKTRKNGKKRRYLRRRCRLCPQVQKPGSKNKLEKKHEMAV